MTHYRSSGPIALVTALIVGACSGDEQTEISEAVLKEAQSKYCNFQQAEKGSVEKEWPPGMGSVFREVVVTEDGINTRDSLEDLRELRTTIDQVEHDFNLKFEREVKAVSDTGEVRQRVYKNIIHGHETYFETSTEDYRTQWHVHTAKYSAFGFAGVSFCAAFPVSLNLLDITNSDSTGKLARVIYKLNFEISPLDHFLIENSAKKQNSTVFLDSGAVYEPGDYKGTTTAELKRLLESAEHQIVVEKLDQLGWRVKTSGK